MTSAVVLRKRRFRIPA